LAVAFSQLALAAYACPIANDSMPPADMRHQEPMPDDCGGMPGQSDMGPNACEVHCLPATHAQSENPVSAPVAALPPLVLHGIEAAPAINDVIAGIVPPFTRPPPLLLFARLLI
jgi:hypothetical protein